MSLSTYADLKSGIKNWLRRGTELDSYIDDIITVGEARIFREVRAKDMETAFASTMATDGTLALPSSYIGLKFAYLNSSPVQWLEPKGNRWIYEKYPNRSTYSRPKFIAREGSNFIFGPFPDSTYTVNGVYYKNIGPVSSSAHALFTNNPDLYLFACLAETTAFIKDDPRTVFWEAKYKMIRDAVNEQTKREDLSGGALTMSAA